MVVPYTRVGHQSKHFIRIFLYVESVTFRWTLMSVCWSACLRTRPLVIFHRLIYWYFRYELFHMVWHIAGRNVCSVDILVRWFWILVWLLSGVYIYPPGLVWARRRRPVCPDFTSPPSTSLHTQRVSHQTSPAPPPGATATSSLNIRKRRGWLSPKKKNRENPRESNIQFSVGIVYSDNSEIVKRAVLFDF